MEVLVFKTNVPNANEVTKVQSLLNSISTISQWNFDLDDRDHILRIVSSGVPPRFVELALNGAGYQCVELED
jgi:hypothetical protein